MVIVGVMDGTGVTVGEMYGVRVGFGVQVEGGDLVGVKVGGATAVGVMSTSGG